AGGGRRRRPLPAGNRPGGGGRDRGRAARARASAAPLQGHRGGPDLRDDGRRRRGAALGRNRVDHLLLLRRPLPGGLSPTARRRVARLTNATCEPAATAGASFTSRPRGQSVTSR